MSVDSPSTGWRLENGGMGRKHKAVIVSKLAVVSAHHLFMFCPVFFFSSKNHTQGEFKNNLNENCKTVTYYPVSFFNNFWRVLSGAAGEKVQR